MCTLPTETSRNGRSRRRGIVLAGTVATDISKSRPANERAHLYETPPHQALQHITACARIVGEIKRGHRSTRHVGIKRSSTQRRVHAIFIERSGLNRARTLRNQPSRTQWRVHTIRRETNERSRTRPSVRNTCVNNCVRVNNCMRMKLAGIQAGIAVPDTSVSNPPAQHTKPETSRHFGTTHVSIKYPESTKACT